MVFSEPLCSFDLAKPKFENPVLQLKNRSFRTRSNHRHTIADPFLVVHDNELFLFVEEKRFYEPGKIVTYKTDDLLDWSPCGIVLDLVPQHVSYPFVFESDSKFLMLPETEVMGEVAFYESASFPTSWSKSKTVLPSALCDSSIIKHEGVFYLFTSCKLNQELLIFHAETIHGPWVPHPMNPVVTGSSKFRNGGGPIVWSNHMFRFAQDCTNSYGEKLHLLKINVLNRESYSESIFVDDYLPRDSKWNNLGGHHFHIAEFKGQVVYAVDGKSTDMLVNKGIGIFFKCLRGISNLFR
jgi:beta-xylosidase